MKKIIVLLICTVYFISCNDDFGVDENVQPTENFVRKDVNLSLKKEFGQAFAKVLAESQDVRKLIREEALKQFDYDYDVLYQFIKNDKLSNGTTLEQLLLKHISSEKLALISEKIPTLTIFVPTLPENSFSAELWDTNNEIPSVGIKTCESNDVPMFDLNGKETIIKASVIPGYPIVVIKENERVIANNKITQSINKKVPSFSTKSNPEIIFSFTNDVFDNTKNRQTKTNVKQGSTKAMDNNLEDKLEKAYEAYDIYNGNEIGWQRDYVYYNISPTNQRGPLNHNFTECLCSFQILGDGKTALNKISDQTGDPNINKNYQFNPRGNTKYTDGWTDGEFEFAVKIYIGNKNSVGNEINTAFRAKAYDLFELSYQKNGGSWILKDITPKKYYLQLPLFVWDLEIYSANIKISIEEVDENEVIRKSTSTTFEYATNFEISTTTGDKDKVGTKYSTTNKITTTIGYETTTTKGSDQLFEVAVNFGDDIVIGKKYVEPVRPRVGETGKWVYDLNSKYYNGWYKIEIAPIKMY